MKEWEFARRVGLAWTGLTLVAVFLLAFRPFDDALWVAPLLAGPLAVGFVRRGYSVRRLWAFLGTIYAVLMAVVVGWSQRLFPPATTAEPIAFGLFWYGTVLLAFGIAYVLVYRGGYARLKRSLAR